jgi:signal transduction histidine kinase
LLAVFVSAGTVEDVQTTGAEKILRELLHELRTPLTALQALEDLGEEGLGAREVLGHLAGVIRRAECQLARSRDNGYELLDARGVVDATVRLVQAGGRNHGIVVNGERDITIRGERVALTQILSNLLSNALRHRREGGEVKVTITKGAGRVTIAVLDDGPGIPEHLHHDVFLPGVSVGGHDGDGIGLNLARRLAEQMHGQLEIGPQENGGCLLLHLPLD